ncbi:MAG: Asp-tRNA(Asn)/Glu-tRNA(Gln) amidotransferase GatCAB subunit C [Chloroflexi bacterium]|nr:Asp-tRNA(Asn)/Glu-tRNA(Gln) amidotransferase GatCAB subunit C [Chloroflexota bacterium]|tara:strand:- start:28702 stop:28992 length:291 start_codon:yes stop_codon:yes gene_type:complete
MDDLTREEILKISELSYLELTDKEISKLQKELSDIIRYFTLLNKLDTKNVELTGHTTKAQSVMREDEVHPPLKTEKVINNAPQTSGEFIKVPPVLE